MTTEEAKKVLEKDILPTYKHLVEVGMNPTTLVASMGLLTELHRMMEMKEIIKDFPNFLDLNNPRDGEVRLTWSGSEEDCTWALV